jgi:hypothetical protein
VEGVEAAASVEGAEAVGAHHRAEEAEAPRPAAEEAGPPVAAGAPAAFSCEGEGVRLLALVCRTGVGAGGSGGGPR